MRYLIVTDDADRPTLEEAINNLRDRQRRCVIPSTRDELQADIDELLDMLGARGDTQPTNAP